MLAGERGVPGIPGVNVVPSVPDVPGVPGVAMISAPPVHFWIPRSLRCVLCCCCLHGGGAPGSDAIMYTLHLPSHREKFLEIVARVWEVELCVYARASLTAMHSL